jgi:hypothetical protein
MPLTVGKQCSAELFMDRDSRAICKRDTEASTALCDRDAEAARWDAAELVEQLCSALKKDIHKKAG